jgi:hypothetical protein
MITTTATPAPGATATTLEALKEINPMIEVHGDPVIVISVLSFLSKMFYSVERNDCVELDYRDSLGLSITHGNMCGGADNDERSG